MEKVSGIGGVFFKAKDPAALRAWYAQNLGIHLEDYGGAMFSWGGEGSEKGVTVWSLFEQGSEYLGARESTHMINYRVRDLKAMLAQLRSNGVWVDEKVDESEFGKFGWARDGEGNRFELWEPPPQDAGR